MVIQLIIALIAKKIRIYKRLPFRSKIAVESWYFLNADFLQGDISEEQVDWFIEGFQNQYLYLSDRHYRSKVVINALINDLILLRKYATE